MAVTYVNPEHIAVNAISGTIIADNAVTAVHIAQNAILTQHIDDGQVGTSQLAADAVTGAKLADSSVVTANIQDDQVTSDKLANNITIAGTLGVTGAATFSNATNTIQADDAFLRIEEADGTDMVYLGDHTGGGAGSLWLYNHGGTATIQLKADTTSTFSDAVTVGGTLGVTGVATFATHVELGDSDILKLGAGADLQIKHDGSNSYITDAGTGALLIASNDFQVVNAAASENMILAAENGAVSLYYDNALKLATANTGVAVTGILSCNNNMVVQGGGAGSQITMKDSGGTVDGYVYAETGAVGFLDDDGHWALQHTTDTRTTFLINNSEKMRIDSTGVGIGTTSPDSKLHLKDTASNSIVQTTWENDARKWSFGVHGGLSDAINLYDHTASASRFTVLADGKVGIGTTSPGAKFHTNLDGASVGITPDGETVAVFSNTSATSDQAQVSIISGNAGSSYLNFGDTDSETIGQIRYRHVDNTMRFGVAGGERMSIISDGSVGIGTTSPDYTLSVAGPTGDANLIAEFYGSRQDGALYAINLLAGSDNDRTGLYWRNAGIVNTRMWCDDTMDIRIHSGNPSSDTDGTVVGTQSFTGTHIYKTDATDLSVGQAVRLVGKKLVKTTSANDKLCVGIYAGQSGKIVDSFGQACNETDGYGHAVIALGDTRMSQSGTTTTGVLVNGSVSAGDLLCTSSTAGKLTTQSDDIIRSYTVGKAMEDGNASAPVYAYIYCG